MELDTLIAEARDLHDETVALRRTLHRWPELGNDLPITRENVLAALEGLPLDITLHETTSGIANMVGILNAYEPASGDPKALKVALEEEFGLIFERCTMEGEAHNQLHNYLLPIHQVLRDFEGDEAQRAALGAQLAVYGNYFE